MWPFKSKEVSKVSDNPRYDLAGIKVMQAWRPIGGKFEYLGRTCVVGSYFEYQDSGGVWVRLCADYADNNGVIHQIKFSTEEVYAMIATQPTQERGVTIGGKEERVGLNSEW